MSSEDVIELGSSDEETEPAPKRSKPMPNAMVCIPRNLHEVTIKPAKPSSVALAKKLSKAITVKKVVNIKPQTAVRNNKFNGRPNQPLKSKVGLNPYAGVKPVFIQNKPTNSKIPTTTFLKPNQKPIIMQNPIKIQNPGTPLNLLPSSITVKKTVSNRPIVMLNVKSKKQINQSGNVVDDVLTVELDDDETPKQNLGPQWYLRPEDLVEAPTLEEENNKEPETPKLVEITIEDSPVKPVLNKRTHEVGVELAITIDDSPVKAVVDKNVASGSDDEKDTSSTKVPHSKKKLEYPKEAGDNIIEIEIDSVQVNINSNPNCATVHVVSLVDDEKTSNDPLKDESSEIDLQTNSEPIIAKEDIEIKTDIISEFNPVYQSFIDLCFQLENSDDMKKIVEKKIKGYYKQVPKEYTESEEFIDMVSSKIISMKAGPDKMYLYIKDIVDELNLQRKLAKAQPVVKETITEEPEQMFAEESEYDSRRQRQIRKLEKTIKKLHRAIQKLEEQEVDFDDDDDSVYLLTERYKERMVRVYAKFCQLSNTKMPSEPRVQIDARPGRPSGPAKRLERWINKKVPIGTPLPFPDFHDVLRCVRDANEEDKLNFNEADIMEEARDLFTRCGKKLQRRRQENEWRLAASRIASEVDPAENNTELQRKLAENRKVAAVKETEIFNKFADRQNQLKLEGEEIGDKEAEESPVESEEEDEEGNDEKGSLGNTEKRKEILKRLLQEKSKKTSEEKENQPSNEAQIDENKVVSMEVDTISKKETDSKEETAKLKKNSDEAPNVEDEANNAQPEEPNGNEKTTENTTETLILSDSNESKGSKDLESDIDELHLLQKLHSGNEGQSSTVDTSDSESAVNISDSLESSDGGKKDDDVISIENSSYSENENDKIDDTQESNADSVQFINDDSMPSQASQDLETVSPTDVNAAEGQLLTTEGQLLTGEEGEGELMTAEGELLTTEGESLTAEGQLLTSEVVHAPPQTNNDEYNEAVEDILLASSEEDSQEEAVSECVNLRDDLISIDETIIGNINTINNAQEDATNTKKIEKDNVDSLEVNIDINVMSTKYDSVEISDTSKTETRDDISQNIVDEVLNETVELMDIDEQENNINESQTNTIEDTTPPSLKES